MPADPLLEFRRPAEDDDSADLRARVSVLVGRGLYWSGLGVAVILAAGAAAYAVTLGIRLGIWTVTILDEVLRWAV